MNSLRWACVLRLLNAKAQMQVALVTLTMRALNVAYQWLHLTLVKCLISSNLLT
jgi:hypothetical protein